MIIRNGAEGMDVQFLGKRMNSMWSGGKIVWPTWKAVDFWTWARYWDPEGGWPKNQEEWDERATTVYDPAKVVKFSSWELLDQTAWANFTISGGADGFTRKLEGTEDRHQMAYDGTLPWWDEDTPRCLVVSNPVQVQSNTVRIVASDTGKQFGLFNYGDHGTGFLLVYAPEGRPAHFSYWPELDTCEGLQLVTVKSFNSTSTFRTGSYIRLNPAQESPIVMRVAYRLYYHCVWKLSDTASYIARFGGPPPWITPVEYNCRMEIESEFNAMPRPAQISGVLLRNGLPLEGGSPMQVLHAGQDVYYLTDRTRRTGQWNSIDNELYSAFGGYSFDMAGGSGRASSVSFSAETVTTRAIQGDDGAQQLNLRYGIPLNVWQDMQEDENTEGDG